MKTNIYSNIISAVVVAGLLASCGSGSEKEQLVELKKQQTEIAKKIKALEAKVGKTGADSVKAKSKEVVAKELAPRKFDYFIQTQGAIESEENIQVSAKSAGVVSQVFVREGEMVTKGQVLAQIDNSLVARNIDELKASLELATTVYNRQKNLWDQKIGTEVQYLQAKNNKESIEKRIASVGEQNDMMRIKSPISGVVDEVTAKAGQNIAPGMPAVRVVNNSDLKVKAAVSESFVTSIKKGNKVIVTVPDLNKDFEAKVTFVGRNINQLSRTFIVEIDMPSNPELRPNMSANIKVIYDSYPSAIAVPINIVQDVNGEKIVYVVEAKGNQNIASRKVITIDGVYDSYARVVKGLNTGDKIITAGFQGLSDGQFIKL